MPQGGILHADLLSGMNQALILPRSEARQRAVQFSWENAAKIFENNLSAVCAGKLLKIR
jgi:hypothetical protein